MRKITLFLGIAICVSTIAKAQKVFVKLNAGYNFPSTFGTPVLLDGFPYLGSGLLYPNPDLRFEESNASMGAGFHLQVAGGYRFAKKWGAELIVDYGLSGSSYTTTQEPFGLPVQLSQKGTTQIIFIPSLSYSIIEKNNSRFYVKLGVVLPLSNTYTTENLTTAASDDYFYTKSKTSTLFTPGAYFGVGYDHPISERFSAFGEFSVTWLSKTVGRLEVTEAEANNVDQMDVLTNSQKEIEYLSDYVDNQNQNSSQRSSASAYKQPFSGVGIRLGIMYKLVKSNR